MRSTIERCFELNVCLQEIRKFRISFAFDLNVPNSLNLPISIDELDAIVQRFAGRSEAYCEIV